MTVVTTVTNHLYLVDQFCGFVGSSGPSHVTIFASKVVSDSSTRNSFGTASWVSSPSFRTSSSVFVDSNEDSEQLEACWDMQWITCEQIMLKKNQRICIPLYMCRKRDYPNPTDSCFILPVAKVVTHVVLHRGKELIIPGRSTWDRQKSWYFFHQEVDDLLVRFYRFWINGESKRPKSCPKEGQNTAKIVLKSTVNVNISR